ncbi:alpha/beta fold hydrolase [Flagellimonas sp. GZD32]|uniref:alpha/beta fold hydrolase n=1 Tax=Flagellimonas cixiensis TaxID=3228750 RepID=UPI0035C91124
MKNQIAGLLFILCCAQIHAQENNYADVNGVKIYYEIHGEGEPLVLLHGFTMSHKMWDGWIEDFSKKYKIILPDLRGHGNSTNPSNEFTHKESAKDIYGLLNLLKIDKFNAMGFSSGGMTLTHMATMDTTRIKSMVLIGSTSFFPESCREIQRNASYENATEEQLKYWNSQHPRGEDQIKNIINQFRQMADSFEDMNFTSPYLSSIKCETFIIHGDRDAFFPAEIPLNSYNSIPNSYLWIIPNFGHSGIDKSSIWGDVFFKTVDKFFSGEWSNE